MSNSSKNNNKPSTYKVDVIQANKTFKDAVRSTGKGLRILKTALKDNVEAKPMLRQIEKILKDEVLYKQLDKNVRRIAKGDNKGKTCPFYILQAVYKMKEGKSNTVTKSEPKTNLKPIAEVKVTELKAKAKAKGIKGYTKMKREELITALKAA